MSTAASNGLVIVTLDIASLNPAPYNPRKMTDDEAKQLMASIQKFGFQQPVVVNRHPDRMNVIVGGHMRVRVAQALGYAQVPCVYVSLTEPEERELNLRMNRNLGRWDWDLLAEFDVTVLKDIGFDEDELRARFQLDADWADTFERRAEANNPNDHEFQVTVRLPRELEARARAAIEKVGTAHDVFIAGIEEVERR